MKKYTDTLIQSQENDKRLKNTNESEILNRMGLKRDKNGKLISKPEKPGYTTLY